MLPDETASDLSDIRIPTPLLKVLAKKKGILQHHGITVGIGIGIAVAIAIENRAQSDISVTILAAR